MFYFIFFFKEYLTLRYFDTFMNSLNIKTAMYFSPFLQSEKIRFAQFILAIFFGSLRNIFKVSLQKRGGGGVVKYFCGFEYQRRREVLKFKNLSHYVVHSFTIVNEGSSQCFVVNERSSLSNVKKFQNNFTERYFGQRRGQQEYGLRNTKL